MAFRASVRLAPGNGLVARRGDVVLFLPERDERLVEAFLAGPDGGELQSVASATVASGFDVAPFVGVSWSEPARVMAFGDVAVETDQPSLPMLSGAGSRTWVEHSLTLGARALITVAGGAEVDPATDLTAGVALAGGFRIELTSDASEPADHVGEAPGKSEAVALAAEPDPTVTAARPEPPPRPETVVTPEDPEAALAAIQAAAMGPDGRPVHQSEPEPSRNPRPDAPVTQEDEAHDAEHPDSEITLPPPPPGELLGEVLGPGGSTTGDAERGSLVDAKLCPAGHPNPPVVASCGVCGQFLTPGATAIVHVPRPSLGHLEFDDGTIVELDEELLVGRNPDRDTSPERAGMRRVKVTGDKVSRSHLEIRYQGWDVLVADCGSTNGTFVMPHPGGQVTALEPGRAQLLEPGATVYFGSRSFTVMGREGR